jgi:non-specific protein-tyrosine kinase
MQVLLAAAIGAMLAVGAAFLIEYLDDTLKSPEEVARTMGISTLGGITRISGDTPAEKLITIRHPKSPISEAYRVMRTNLQFSSLDRPLKSLVVTSPNPVEGKSTTLANLGVVMAQAGNSVVLVDSDLRRPMLHKIFQLSNKQGLTSALLEDEPLVDGHLQDTGIENLRVLTSGPLPPNPSELLGSQKMQHLVRLLEAESDIVVFDTPPTLPVTDAAVLSTQTDGVLLVADAAKTRRAAARQAAENLRKVGANILGAALNRLSTRRSGSHYYYYYYYAEDNKGRRRRQRRWYQKLPLIGRLFI